MSRTLLFSLAAIALAASGCSPSPSIKPTLPVVATASLSIDPSLTPVPGGSSVATPPPAGQPATQTDTEWGRIWDALPPSFPLPPDAVSSETREGPVSATYALGMSAEQAADVMVAGLTERGARVDRSNPGEDGSVVIQALGPEPPCEVQVRLTPLSGTTSMVVMFGAGCPFE